MELLDLRTHDPDDYAGKAVRSHGAEYLVGPRLARGEASTVHHLVNRRSGLGMLVIRIVRQPRPKGLYTSMLAKLRANAELARIVPVTHEIDIPGGIAELQASGDIIGQLQAHDPFAAHLDSGLAALDRQEFEMAAADFEAVLAANPAHTMAMINLAAAVHGKGEPARAMSLANEAVQIEPNLFLYRVALVKYAAEAGLPRLALGHFQQAQEVFENVHDLHETAVEIHLHCGEPEQAQALLGEAIVDEARRKELSKAIARGVAAKARAAKCMATAHRHVERHEWQPALDALERGHALYDKHRLLNVNYALALNRAGRSRQAAALLLEAANAVAGGWHVQMCWANAGYCLLDADDCDGALQLLSHAARDLAMRNAGAMPEHVADLPGVAIWVDADGSIEERLDTAAERIEAALASVAADSESARALQPLAGAMRLAIRKADAAHRQH